MAQDCEGGVQEMLDVIFGFLARKTDFYTSGLENGKAEELINAAYKKHAASAEEESAKKKVNNRTFLYMPDAISALVYFEGISLAPGLIKKQYFSQVLSE